MALTVKAMFGALVVVLISLLSRGKSFYLAALVPLFPTFTLIAHYSVGMVRSSAELKATIAFTALSMIPYMLYLLTMYLLADRVKLENALIGSTVVWLAAAALLVTWWKLSAATSAA